MSTVFMPASTLGYLDTCVLKRKILTYEIDYHVSVETSQQFTLSINVSFVPSIWVSLKAEVELLHLLWSFDQEPKSFNHQTAQATNHPSSPSHFTTCMEPIVKNVAVLASSCAFNA